MKRENVKFCVIKRPCGQEKELDLSGLGGITI